MHMPVTVPHDPFATPSVVEMLAVIRGHPGCSHFSRAVVPPAHLQQTLDNAIMAAEFAINHHRFANFHSFTGLIKALYVLQAGPGAPEMGKVLCIPHGHSGALLAR
jgi:hypothetical protein